jgi:hypothetical protein
VILGFDRQELLDNTKWVEMEVERSQGDSICSHDFVNLLRDLRKGFEIDLYLFVIHF